MDLRRLSTWPRFQALAERVGPVPPGAFAEVEVLDLLLTLTQFYEHGAELAAVLSDDAERPDEDGVWDLIRQWRRPDLQELVQRMLLERTGAAVEMARRARGLEELAGLDPARTTVVLYWLLRKLGRHELAGELAHHHGATLAALEPVLGVCRVLLKAARDMPELLLESTWPAPGGAVH